MLYPTLTALAADYDQPGDVVSVVLVKVSSKSFIDAVTGQLADPLPGGQSWDQGTAKWVDGPGTKLPTVKIAQPDGYCLWFAAYDPPGVKNNEVLIPHFYHSRIGSLGPGDFGVAPRPTQVSVTLRT
jgi:hypothetical protein